MASNPFDQFDQPTAAPQGFVPFGGPDPKAAYEAPLVAANLQAVQARNAMSGDEARRVRAAADGAALDLEMKRRQLASDGVKTRALTAPEQQRLGQTADTFSALSRARANFNPAYAGNSFANGSFFGGELENIAQGQIGTGTPGQRDYWADFRSTDNSIRNSLFGASLTDGEKAAFAATTVDPSMDPAEVRKNLVRREDLARNVLSRQVRGLKANGAIPEAVDAFVGDVNLTPQQGKSALGTKPAQMDQEAFNARIGQMLVSGMDASAIASFAQAQGRPLDATQQRNVAANVTAYRGGYRGAPSVRTDPNAPPPARGAPTSNDPAIAAAIAARLKGSDAFGAGVAGLADSATFGFADEIGSGVDAIGDALAGRGSFSDAYARNLAINRGVQQGLSDQNPYAYGAGQVGGLIAGGIGGARAIGAGARALGAGGLMTAAGRGAVAARTLGGEALEGAAYGLGSGTEGNRLKGGAIGAAVAPVGGMIGRTAARTAGRVLAPTIAPIAQRLMGRGIPLTMGQVGRASGSTLGRFVGGVEDRLAGLPGIGDVVNARRREGVQAFNRSEFNAGMSPIGVQSPQIGTAGMAASQDAIGNAYDAALRPMRLTADAPFQADMQAALAQGGALPSNLAESFNSVVNDRIAPIFNSGNGAIDGLGLQGIKQGIRQDQTSFTGQPLGHRLSDALGQAEDAVFGMARRQDPAGFAAYQNADKAFANMLPVERAVLAAKNGTDKGPGIFSPAQYGTALQAADRSSRKRMSAAARSAAWQRQQDAVAVLPNVVPDSGTAGRIALGALGIGAAGGGATVDPKLGIGLGLGAAAFSRTGQRALTRGMFGNPGRLAGRALRSQTGTAGIGTMAEMAALSAYLDQIGAR